MTAPNVFCFSTELIYEEVIDWEERNKNGLMKEDCSGTSSFITWKMYRKCSVLTLNTLPKRYISRFPPVFVSDVVSGSASQSSSANDISSMSTEHTLASDTDSSSIDTLTGPLDESQWTQSMATCVCPPQSSHLQYPKINQPSPSYILFTPPPPVFWLSILFLSSLTSLNTSIFLFLSCWTSSTSNVYLGLLPWGQRCLFSLLGQQFIFLFFVDIVYRHIRCMHPYWFFRLPGVGGEGGLLFVPYACILIVLFF